MRNEKSQKSSGTRNNVYDAAERSSFRRRPYPDVEDNASYAEAVETLNVLGIMIGDEKGNFNPEASITRAEINKKLLNTVLLQQII